MRCVAVLLGLLPATVSAQEPILPGAPFPAATYGNLNTDTGGPPTIDLAQTLGQQPLLLFGAAPQGAGKLGPAMLDRGQDLLAQVTAVEADVSIAGVGHKGQ